MALTAQSLLAELDATLGQASDSWRGAVLRRIADLFVGGAESYRDEQTALFGDVLSRLMQNADREALAELSSRLAPLGNAPEQVVRSLARHRGPAVCGPVLEQAQTLADKDLAEIAMSDRIEQHLLMKIAARPQLGEATTDALLKRGLAEIARMIAANPHACISEAGFARLVSGVNGDKSLAAVLAARTDMPAELQPFLAAVLNR